MSKPRIPRFIRPFAMLRPAIYADSSRPTWVAGFTRNTYIAMVEGARDQALAAGLIDRPAWDMGIADLEASAGPDGTFSYTFFKAVAVSP